MHARASAVRIVVDSSLRARKGKKSGRGVPQAHSKSFPNAAEIGRKTEFLTVNARFGRAP
jgi:hypothetical protein